MTGKRVMTATSGPGISLYSENIGLAIMGEVPMVIVDVQRMGPATGGATTVGQGDIQFLRWGTSGGYPVIVLSPSSVAECYSLTCKASTWLSASGCRFPGNRQGNRPTSRAWKRMSFYSACRRCRLLTKIQLLSPTGRPPRMKYPPCLTLEAYICCVSLPPRTMNGDI
jgi:hypothetical protein